MGCDIFAFQVLISRPLFVSTMRIELENRLIDFSVTINELVSYLKKSILSQNLSQQIIRSSTSAALNFGEAQSAESRKDFIHKMSIVLKELRETEICLKILCRSKTISDINKINGIISECKQLIAIFQKSINTAKANSNKQ